MPACNLVRLLTSIFATTQLLWYVATSVAASAASSCRHTGTYSPLKSNASWAPDSQREHISARTSSPEYARVADSGTSSLCVPLRLTRRIMRCPPSVASLEQARCLLASAAAPSWGRGGGVLRSARASDLFICVSLYLLCFVVFGSVFKYRAAHGTPKKRRKRTPPACHTPRLPGHT